MKKVFPFLNKKEDISAPSKCLLVPSTSKNDEKERKTPETEKKVFGGSATGNPRNKCALKPGHSLIDWIRLGTSGVDLAGTKGIITPVSSVELAKHCSINDAWMAIHGKVYNVTQYMDFHPGGIDELKKGIGKDGTALFTQVHAWVNYEQLLAKCFIGPLRNIVQVDLQPIKQRQKAITDCFEKSEQIIENEDNSLKKPLFPIRLNNSEKNSPAKSINSDESFKLNNLKEVINENQEEKSSFNSVPRFDWIQNSSDITLIFYTRQFLNPGLVISYKTLTEINLRIFFGTVMHEYNFEFCNEIRWPCSIKISKETGKIDIIFDKMKSQLWSIYGKMTYENTYKNTYDYSDKYEFEIEQCSQFNHDSFGLILKSSNNQVIIFTPIGYHLSLTALINGESVTRSYTPVPLSYLPYQQLNVSYKIAMLIKSYQNGTLAKYVTNQAHNPLKIKLSAPKGNFSLKKLLDHNRIALLAAGSGITPILGVLDYLLSRNNDQLQHLELLFFNRSEKDIWCKEKLDYLSLHDNRVKIRYILSENVDNWKGEKGRISKNIISSLNDKTQQSFVTFCCICGSMPFNELALKLLQSAKFSPDQMFCFQG